MDACRASHANFTGVNKCKIYILLYIFKNELILNIVIDAFIFLFSNYTQTYIKLFITNPISLFEIYKPIFSILIKLKKLC